MKARKLVKKGRPRKEVSRKGKAARIVHEDPRKAVLDQPHRRAFRSVQLAGDPKPKDRRGDDRAHDVFGRLYLSGEITLPQYESGVSWLEAWLAYARVTGIPTGRIKGTLAQSIKGQDNRDLDSAQADRIKVKYHTVRNIISDGQYNALVDVLVHDQWPTGWDLGLMREGLNAIGRQSSGR